MQNLNPRPAHIAPVQEGKGRTFTGTLLAYATASSLWDGGETNADTIRPVWAVFAGTEQELRPFILNALAGRKVVLTRNYSRRDDRLELLKSARYDVVWQRESEGAVATVLLPDLFRVDPGMVDPKGARFIVLPRRQWIEAQTFADAEGIVEHGMKLGYPVTEDELHGLVAIAYLFAVYLDRRTRCPIYADGRFYLQLLLAFFDEGAACFPRALDGYRNLEGFGKRSALLYADDMSVLGVAPAVAFSADHETIERVLAEETVRFFALSKGT